MEGNMELVDAIFYKKINPGDLLNIDLSLHVGGGGQTYLDLAGIPEDLLNRFLEYGTIIERKNPPLDDHRQKYGINAYAIGTNNFKLIEFDPRNNRPNYKLSDQRGNRHPAWTSQFGFPQSPHDARYAKDITKIPNLLIYIIRTSEHKYYAGYVNRSSMPTTWPVGIGLERLFIGERRGVFFFENGIIQFNNNAEFPFSIITTITNIDTTEIPENIQNQTTDAVEYSDNDILVDIVTPELQFAEFSAPIIPPTAPTRVYNRRGRHINQERAQRNRTAIGRAGEQAVVEFEKRRLVSLMRPDLADQVDWVSQTQGDGLGYDVHSFDVVDGTVIDRFIEVKTTTGAIIKPFDISSNEVAFSIENPDFFVLFRIFEFDFHSSDIRYYCKSGSIEANFTLTPTGYLAVPSN